MALVGILTVLLKADITQLSHHRITEHPPPNTHTHTSSQKTTLLSGCDLDAPFNIEILIMRVYTRRVSMLECKAFPLIPFQSGGTVQYVSVIKEKQKGVTAGVVFHSSF